MPDFSRGVVFEGDTDDTVGGAVPVTKEIVFTEVRAVRFEGLALKVADTRFVSVRGVVALDGPSPVALTGVESQTFVGMAKFELKRDGENIAIQAQGLLDFNCPERLLLETGELALDIVLGLGSEDDSKIEVYSGQAWPRALTIFSARLIRVCQNHPLALTKAPMNWMF